MVSLETANNALKSVYLEVLRNQLNDNIDCVMGKIAQTSKDIWGKEIHTFTYINGKHYQLKSELANIYGRIEISDKAVRASQNSAGAFVELLNSEMENLIKETGRQLTNAFYSEDKPHDYITEGEKKAYQPLILNGLKYLFDENEPLLYGVDRKEIAPITKKIDKFDDATIQELIDDYNEDVDFIVCSPKTKREYQQYLSDNRRNVEIIQMGSGWNCLAFNGIIPIATNRNVPDNEIYLISTKDFKLHQLCDWQWIEGENGSVLRQVAGLPKYSALLVKYANYICEQPQRQIKVIKGE